MGFINNLYTFSSILTHYWKNHFKIVLVVMIIITFNNIQAHDGQLVLKHYPTFKQIRLTIILSLTMILNNDIQKPFTQIASYLKKNIRTCCDREHR